VVEMLTTALDFDSQWIFRHKRVEHSTMVFGYSVLKDGIMLRDEKISVVSYLINSNISLSMKLEAVPKQSAFREGDADLTLFIRKQLTISVFGALSLVALCYCVLMCTVQRYSEYRRYFLIPSLGYSLVSASMGFDMLDMSYVACGTRITTTVVSYSLLFGYTLCLVAKPQSCRSEHTSI
jgi:hypothetical protein